MWCDDATDAEGMYGHISTWDTSGVTDMSYLFSPGQYETYYEYNTNTSEYEASASGSAAATARCTTTSTRTCRHGT